MWCALGLDDGDAAKPFSRSRVLVISLPLKILEQVSGGGGIDFSFGTVDPSVVAISGQEKLGLTVIWDGPASIRMRKPSGEKITIPLPPRAFFPVAMSDDCETRTLDGTMSQGPVDLAVETSFDSPGCD